MLLRPRPPTPYPVLEPNNKKPPVEGGQNPRNNPRNLSGLPAFPMKEGQGLMTSCFRHDQVLRAMLILAIAASLAGCGVVAFPVRTTSAAVKIVPVAGDVVAAPLDWTADAID